MQYSKKHTLLNKSNLPLGQCSVFLQGQYPNKIWCIPSKVAPCPLKECSVHFQMSKLPFKRALPLLEKSIFLHNMCRIIDIEHPFQKCNMFETVSIIKEWFFFASYNIILSYMACNTIFLWRSSILGELDYFCVTCVLFPLVRSAKPSFRQLSLKEIVSILSNNNVFV